MVVYPFTEKFPLDSKWNAASGSFQWKISESKGTSDKEVLFFRHGTLQTENCVPFLQCHVDTSVRPSRSFYGKWN